MKTAVKYSLAVGVLLPLVMLLWPFAMWGSAASLVLRVIAAFCGQILFCICRLPKGVKLLPFVGTLVMAFWGTWLYITSPHWINAELGDLLADYVSPAISCAVALAVMKWKNDGKTNQNNL